MPPDAGPSLKPRLRGWSHQWAFFASLVAGAVLVAMAPSPRARLAMAVYAVSVAALFGTSALYHRHDWATPRTRAWMRRLDHSMIFLLIAGTYTPFGLLALEGGFATAMLVAVWAGALAGIVFRLVWISAPKWLVAAGYVALGWVAVAVFPQLVGSVGITATAMVGAGGVLYTAGAVVYALRRPNPSPTVFGYHEIFHLLVIAAAGLQYAAIAFFVLPGAE